MRILVINGSPRTNGLTASILHSMESELVQLGNDVEYVDLMGLDMKHCLGCCSCYRTGHCVMNDGAEVLSEKIRLAEGLVLGSPTYASNVSGLMKDFIDRGHFVIEQMLTGKYCVTVATGENYGCSSTRKILDDLVLYSGGILCGHIAVKAPFNGKDAVSRKIAHISHRAARRLNDKKGNILLALFHSMVFRIGIRPFVMRKGESYKGVIERWELEGIL